MLPWFSIFGGLLIMMGNHGRSEAGLYRAVQNSPPSKDLTDVIAELENARSLLASTFLGLEFLIKEVNAVKKEAKSIGQISAASEVTLLACAGLSNDHTPYCRWMNWINKIQSAQVAERGHTRF